AWPLPSDPGDRAKMRAIAPIAFDAIDRHVKGVVVPSEFGDTRAPMIGVIAAPGSGESIAELTKGAQLGLGRVASGYGDALGVDAIKQSALYDLYAGLEDGSGRDEAIASDVLAGHDPSAAWAAAFRSVNEMTRDDVVAIASGGFDYARATVVHLKASTAKK